MQVLCKADLLPRHFLQKTTPPIHNMWVIWRMGVLEIIMDYAQQDFTVSAETTEQE